MNLKNLNVELENVSCLLCGSNNSIILRTAKDRLQVTDSSFTLVRCNNCGCVYQNPRVKPKMIGMFYPPHYFPTRPGRGNKNKKHGNRIAQRKCKLITMFVRQPGRLLEVGSANGDFLATAKQQGWQVEGVEVSSDAVKFSREEHGLDVFHGELLEYRYDGAGFDVIALWAVLPHLHNPVQTISCAANMLTTKGKLLSFVQISKV